MSCDEFYKLNPTLFKRYKKFYENKLECARKSLEEKSWLDGIYVGHAISATFSKNGKYPKHPEVFKAGSGKDESDKPLSDVERFSAFIAKFNANKKNFSNTRPGGKEDG